MKQKKVVYYDYLRVVATLSVILLHTAAQNWRTAGIESLAWNIFNLCDSITRWAVPVFVMISGSLFLSRTIDTKNLYTKYIARMVVAYFVWSTIYALYTPISECIQNPAYVISRKKIVFAIIEGPYHMWFIPMIVGIYMLIPLLQKLTESRKTAAYFLLLSFIFAALIPEAVNISKLFIGGLLHQLITTGNGIISDMNMSFVDGYACYFVLGYVLSDLNLTKKQRYLIYSLGILGFTSTVFLTAAASWKAQSPVETFYGNKTVNVALEAVAVFVWFKYRNYNRAKLNAVVASFSKWSFGIYLVHVFVLERLEEYGIDTMMCSPLLSVPLVTLLTTVFSLLVSFALHKIPFINKWIV